MILILLVINLLFAPKIVNAQISVTDYPSSIITGDSFPITFSFSPSNIGVSYHYKIVGDGVNIITLPNTSCSSSYDECETFSVGDTNPITATAYGKINTSVSSFGVKIRIAHSETHSTITSSPVTVIAISPTPTLTPTPSPPNTPTPTPSTPTPTITPTPIPTSTPAPTAEPVSIRIDSVPSSVSLGSPFSIRFIASHLNSNTEYYVKAYGGIDDNYYFEIQNGTSWYNFNSAWDNMPKFKSNSNGEINQLLFLRAKADKETGSYKIKVKLREPEVESEISYVIVTKFVPSPTSTPPEPTPTEEIIPTPEPLPTNYEVTETPGAINILGLSDGDSLSSTSSPIKISKQGGNMIPVILISSGGVLLLIPLLVSKIRDGR